MPVYSDLLTPEPGQLTPAPGPAPNGAQAYAAAQGLAEPAAPPAHSPPPPPPAAPSPEYGGPAAPAAPMAGPPGQPDWGTAAPQIPQQRTVPPPAGGESTGDGAADAERSGPRVGVIVGAVLIGATVLVLGTIGVVFFLGWLAGSGSPSSFQIGDCVAQSGNDAVLADCAEPGAFRITSRVNTREECPDPAQPALEVGSGDQTQWYCLISAAAPEAPEAGTDDADEGDEAGEDSGDEGQDPDGEADG